MLGQMRCLAPAKAAAARSSAMRHLRPRHAPATIAQASKAKGFGTKKKGEEKTVDGTAPCPCGSGSTLGACCYRYISKEQRPSTAEALLRARYTSYAIKNAEFIADTTNIDNKEYPGSRDSYLKQVRATQRRSEWLGLNITKQEPGDNEAYIYFTASFVDKDDKDGKRLERNEKSHFVKDRGGSWSYMGSELDQPEVLEGAQQPAISLLPDIKLPSFQLPSFKL